MEAVMLRQMLQSSGAFKATDTAGSQIRTDLFIETLADAVAKAGGLGIAKMLQRELGGGAPEPAAAPPSASRRTAFAPVAARANPIDDLDDPNSSAPLPEDPEAASIDDFQPGAAAHHAAPAAAPALGAAPAGGGEVTDEITSGFGPRVHPLTHDVRFHTGVDLRAREGAPIRAAAAGVVRSAGPRGGYGNAVEIDHGNGTSTLYAHASALLVEAGQRVAPGQAVALVGQTGSATGPHLHFELRRNDHPVDPTSALPNAPNTRALNRYRARVEDTVAGTPSSAAGSSHESYGRQSGGWSGTDQGR
jgi:murein DD-endopeptidase MepM/ murein hydrolase activator NlpD